MRVTIGGEAPDGAQADGDAEPWTLEEAVRALSPGGCTGNWMNRRKRAYRMVCEKKQGGNL